MNGLDEALVDLKQGKVIAYPSEGVWGLGCDPVNEEAVYRLLKLKNRSVSKGLILVGSKLEQMKPYININKYKAKLMTKWPGPHTWIVPTRTTPVWIRGNYDSVALRVSNHPIITEICNKFEGAMVSTSANMKGEKPVTTKQEVKELFGTLNIVEGSLGTLNNSTPIQDVETDEWIRE